MLTVTITVDPGDSIVFLQQLAARMQNLDEFLLMLGEKISEQISFNFDSAPWPPLAAATIARKQAGGYPLEPLVRSGQMKEDATSGLWEASNLGGVAKAVLYGPGYSFYHMDGTDFMPARDFTFLPDSFENTIESTFEAFINA